MDLIKPDLNRKIEQRQTEQKTYHDEHSRLSHFNIGDLIYARNVGQGNKWIPGHITEVTGPMSFRIELSDGQIISQHQDHVQVNHDARSQDVEVELHDTRQASELLTIPMHTKVRNESSITDIESSPICDPTSQSTVEDSDVSPQSTSDSVNQFPKRITNLPNYFLFQSILGGEKYNNVRQYSVYSDTSLFCVLGVSL